jgi:hypothetical protein
MEYLTLWVIVGLVNALYNIHKEWYDHVIFEASASQIVIDTMLKLFFGAVLGPIGVIVSIYESR